MAIYGEIHLFENDIKDPYVQENFKRIKIFLRDTPLFKAGFVFKDFSVPVASPTVFSYKHNLVFIPKDVILLSATNDAVITWHYDSFDKTNIYLTASVPCEVRAFFGLYKDESE